MRYKKKHKDASQRAIDGMEMMRAVQKGQLKRCPEGDICAQSKLIHKLFGLAA